MSVLDQEQVVLAHEKAEPFRIERGITDTADERMVVLGLPEVRGPVPELIAKAHRCEWVEEGF